MTIGERMNEELWSRKIRRRKLAPLLGIPEKKLSLSLHDHRKMSAAEFLGLCLLAGLDPAMFFSCDDLDGVRARAGMLDEGKEVTGNGQ